MLRPLPPTTPGAKIPKPRPAFSFDNSVPPPALNNTGTDYARITTSLLDYGAWVLAHRPDVALLDNFIAPGGPTDKDYRHDIPILRESKLRFVETMTGPTTASVISVGKAAATVSVVQPLTRQTTVSANGKEKSGVACTTTTYRVLIARESDGKWYLARVDEIARA